MPFELDDNKFENPLVESFVEDVLVEAPVETPEVATYTTDDLVFIYTMIKGLRNGRFGDDVETQYATLFAAGYSENAIIGLIDHVVGGDNV